MTQLGAVTALESLQEAAEAQPNTRQVAELRQGQRLGVKRLLYHKYGRVSRPYAGLEEFSWCFQVFVPALAEYDASWPHIKAEERGWRTLPLGTQGEREARRLLSGESWDDILASRPGVAPLRFR